MADEDYTDDESEYGPSSARAVITDALFAPFRALVSKSALRLYLNTLLFMGAAALLIGISAVAYGIFYFKFIPTVGLQREVHLQFGDSDHPWGIAHFDSEFVPFQAYDVSVTLELPRTPENLDAGNFMLDLTLFSSRPASSLVPGPNNEPISHSRRPAIMTYASPLVDVARRAARMPLYVVSWYRESETLVVPMMEHLEFAKGTKNLPQGLQLEIQSDRRMQIYSAKVDIRARLTGLRWVMYHWKITSFVVFSSLFWSVSMLSASLTWLAMTWILESMPKEVIKEESEDVIKEESEDGDSEESPEVKKEESETRLLSSYPAEGDGASGSEMWIIPSDCETKAGETSSPPFFTSTTSLPQMHILVTNDDGPPSNQSSPYVHSLVQSLQAAGHTVSVILPHQQRSWIGKAHIVGASVKPTYFRPGTLHQEDGTIHHLPRGSDGEPDDEGDEWVLIDSTPASCVQIGLYHYFQERGPVDVIISGPNYGRNTTALFALSSGTIGAAMEGACCGKRSIALSYAFSSRNHDPVIIAEASAHSVKLIEHLCANWDDNVHLYSVNVPLEPGVSENKIMYTDMLQNTWTGSCFQAVEPRSADDPDLQEQQLRDAGEVAGEKPDQTVGNSDKSSRGPRIQHKHFKWAPSFRDVFQSVEESAPGNDGWTVKEQMTSVTPLKANFMHAPGISGEIKLSATQPSLYSLIDCDDPYVQQMVERALTRRLGSASKRVSSVSELPDSSSPLFQYREYERLDFEHIMSHFSTSLSSAYIIRKALIRKHYLSNTVANWISKHPDSILRKHFKPAFDFELDYAEFLDDALLEAYELNDSLAKNAERPDSEKEWWILKPGMSDRGQGIRIFNSEDQLREIFEEWEEDSDDESGSEKEEDDEAEGGASLDTGIVTSQLRHFLAQPYIDPPLLLPSSSNRKFHIRTYVLASGSLKVHVFKEMLALFAAKPYCAPHEEDDVADLARHLTNTCFQEGGSSNEGSVRRFWDLDHHVPGLSADWKEKIFDQICAVTGEVFEAAARGMMIHFQTLPNAFELFGVDFLVDSNGDTWLLELNAYPDFAQTGEQLKEVVVGRLFEEVVDVAVKPFFGLGDGVGTGDMKLVADIDLGRHA
ncbi:Survival protein SurE-like phosphatase/nucleotidase [Penicillium bovifimosum]|uniref:Survival protein SurE-like phosphatase/nucleotidase n=1 Tax=Penicillium bovifimosum TaxID=126998 RepID=A0A9W9H0B0_9EURO|nr:Survival protein SurE-like phosphatase/nucleotidase [Penicillium bovifimosum]KAJ5135266.1 Survival protein SurE-like phosphatase/nucleotidase [Penicillium bovifimosum]